MSWPFSRLDQLAESALGKMLDKQKNRGNPRPYLRNINVRWGTFDLSDVQQMPFEAHEEARFSVQCGDLVVCEGGEPGRCAVWSREDPIFIQKAVHRVRCGAKLVPMFLAYWLRHLVVSGELAELTTGTTIRHLPGVALAALRVPHPPVHEQKRIVAAIDTHFSRLDVAIASLKHAKTNVKRARASVLKAAVEGRLVPTEAGLARTEGRDYEPASTLLARTEAPPRPNRYKTRSTDVVSGHAALSIGDTQSALPEGWARSAMVDVARMESGHTPSRSHPAWWEGDVPWIGIADAREHHGSLIHDTEQHTNEEGLANSAARLLPQHTVCVSRTASVGYVVVLGRPMATSQDFVNWICSEAVDPHWVRVVFMADREALIRFGKGSVHKTIYFPELLSLHIAVPPLAEQHRIVAEVDRRLSVLDALDTTIDSNLARCARLRQAILKRAFEGRLVWHDLARQPGLTSAVAS